MHLRARRWDPELREPWGGGRARTGGPDAGFAATSGEQQQPRIPVSRAHPASGTACPLSESRRSPARFTSSSHFADEGTETQPGGDGARLQTLGSLTRKPTFFLY